MIEAARSGRNSIGVEIDPEFVRIAYERLRKEAYSLFERREILIYGLEDKSLDSSIREMERT